MLSAISKNFVPVFFFVYFHSIAQSGEVTSGGEATGVDGSISYSVGQTAFSPIDGNTIIPGLQQSYLIVSIDNYDDSISLYPNPASGNVNLKINSHDFADYGFQLIDMLGHILISEQAIATETNIPLEQFANTFYLIKVFKKGKKHKVFKLIKSQ